MTVKTMTLASMLVACLATPTLAWDGVDTDSGQSVTIEQGNLVRTGNEIEIYDWDSGTYRSMEVESIDRTGSTVEMELYDNETGETRTFEFED